MILNTRKGFHEQSGWEKVEYKLRTWLYTLMHELLQSQVATPPLYKLLLLIEALQFFWYTIHKDYSFTWTVQVSTWIQQAVEYLQFDALLSKNDQNFFVIALYLVFSIQLIILILSMLTIFRLVRSNKKTSTVLAYSLKFLSIYGTLLNTILAFPFYNIFIGALYCSSSDNIHGTLTCYSGEYWGHFAVGLIGIFVLLFTSFLFNILYIDLNPRSNIPFAAPQSRLNLLRMVLKIAVIIYTVIDQSKNAAKPFIAVYAVMWLLILVLRYRQTPYYNRSIFNYVLALDSMVFWATIVGLVEAFIATSAQNETGIFYLFLGFPIISYVFINICAKRRIMFKELTLKNFKKDTDVEMYINIIYHMIENRDQPDNRIALEGLLKFYIKHSHRKDGESPAYTLAKEYIKEEEADEKLWYMWVKEIMVDSFEKFQKSARLHMLYAYIQREKLHNKFKALFEMMITEENKPNMEEEFAIYRYKNLIEEEMIDNDSRNSESKGVDVNIIVHFQNKFVDFQTVVEKAVDLHLDFWRELLEHNPDIHKLQMLGSEITHSVEETTDHFRRLNEINPNHIKMLQIYGNFLKDIVNDDAEGQRILEKAEYVDKSAMVNKQFIDNDRIKYGENSNTCIITCSGNFNDMGIITNVNNEIVRILQYNKAEIIGQPINRIMPKILADSHDAFMKNYFETSESKIIGQERDVFPTSKAGYVVPCTLMIKVLPNLNEGIRMVGFLKDIEKDRLAKNPEFDTEEKDHYIIYGGDNGIIHGITYSCKQEFGIPSSLVWGAGAATNEFTIDSVFPELLSHDVSELKAASGVVTTLDTSNLRQNYLIAHNQSEESQAEEEEEDKEKKFRKTKVRAIMIQDEIYKDASMKVLKFFEVHDDDDLKKENSNVKQSAQEDGEKEEAEEKVKDNDAHDNSQENENRSEGSSLSAGEGADDIRTLKDFKALISEKTTPKSIKVLSRAVILMFILLIILTSLDLAFRFDQISTFQTGITTVEQGYERHNLMAEINYRIRMLQLLATGMLLDPPTTLEDDLRGDLVSLIDSLSSVQFQIMTATQTLASDNYYTVDSEYITLEHLLETSVNTEKRIYTDSVFQYITAASSIRNSTLTQLSTPSTIDSTLKNFYFVRRNGLGPLRVGSEKAADNFMNYYMDKADGYNTRFEVIMIVGILLLAISEFILIPIVFSVHRTNNRVLSLFGFIPISEITELAAKCERYMANYLEDHKERKDYSGEESDAEGENQEQASQQGKSYIDNSQAQDQELVEGDSVHPDASAQMDVSEKMDANPIGIVPVNSVKKSQSSKPGEANLDRSGMPINHAKLDKSAAGANMAKRPIQLSKEEERKNAAEAEADADLLNDRSQKLLNSRDNRKGKVIFQFTLITLTFVAYYIADYVHELTILDNVRNSYKHLQLSAQRMPSVRYVIAFTQEIIAEEDVFADVYTYPHTTPKDLRNSYLIATQTNDKNLRDSEKTAYPSSFDSYFNTFGLYNDQDLCNSYYKGAGETKCNNVASGLLSKGISVSVTTITLNSDDVYSAFHDLADRTLDESIQLSLNQTKFTDSRAIQDNVLPACQSLITDYISAFNDYMDQTTNDERIKFAIFVIWCFFVFFILWGQYLKSLNDKIFRTKGMLNMIPMDIISKNESLKQLFFSGDILQAVK